LAKPKERTLKRPQEACPTERFQLGTAGDFKSEWWANRFRNGERFASESAVKLLIVDELGYVPFTAVGSELLFEVFSQRYERGATLVTSNLPFDEWTTVFGSERLTGALLDRLTHHVHILEMNGESFRLATSKKSRRRSEQIPNAGPQTSTKGDAATEAQIDDAL